MAEYNDPKLDAWGPETTITNAKFTSNSVEIDSVPVRSNLTNGQLWGIDPIPTNAVSGYEPLWDSDDDNISSYSPPLRPEPLWESAGDNSNPPLRTEALWDSDDDDVFDGRPRKEPLWDSQGQAWRPLEEISNPEGTKIDSKPISDTEKSASSSVSESKPPSPPQPSTRPYIWKYK